MESKASRNRRSSACHRKLLVSTVLSLILPTLTFSFSVTAADCRMRYVRGLINSFFGSPIDQGILSLINKTGNVVDTFYAQTWIFEGKEQDFKMWLIAFHPTSSSK
jgi:hypothetical protein